MNGHRICRAIAGAALALPVLAGCGDEASPSAAAREVTDAAGVDDAAAVLEEIDSHEYAEPEYVELEDTGGEEDAFAVSPDDVRIESCGPDPDDGPSAFAIITVTNSAPMTRHFHVTVNTYGPDGVRDEPVHITAYSVAPGETARAEGTTGEDNYPGIRCETGQLLAVPSDGIPDGDWWWLDEAH